MGLTTAVRARLENAGFFDVFEEHKDEWIELGRQQFAFAKQAYTNPYPDDVAQHLALVLEANPTFIDAKAARRERARYWFRYFADLVVTVAWDDIQKQGGGDQ